MKTQELQQTKRESRAWEGLESVLVSKEQSHVDECEHTPDRLDLLGTDYCDDRIIQHFSCRCGKNVDEIFIRLETVVF
jgi:hypothetical protein